MNLSIGMKERPILFKGEMVRAILEDRKTQTRRIVKTDLRPQSKDTFMHGFPLDPQNVRLCGMYAKCDAPAGSRSVSYRVPCPHGWIGDRLWVKETFAITSDGEKDGISFKADAGSEEWLDRDRGEHWSPSIFMRRYSSRIDLEIVMIGLQRLNEISEDDAIAEGVQVTESEYAMGGSAKNAYRSLWESINGPASWALNPWVWVIKFKRL